MKKTTFALLSIIALTSTTVFAEDGSDRTLLGQQIRHSYQDQNKTYAIENGSDYSKADQSRVNTSDVTTPDVMQ